MHDGKKSRVQFEFSVRKSVAILAQAHLLFHHCGLVTLTHTPSPMGFLNGILRRPPNEKAFLLLVVGYPAKNAMVPDIERKPLEASLTEFG